MKNLKYLLNMVFFLFVISLLNSCSEDKNSAFYQVDPNAKPSIPDYVVGEERVITGRIYTYGDFGVPTAWDFGESKIYAVLTDVEGFLRYNTLQDMTILSEGIIDEYGQYSLTLPDSIPKEFVEYASEWNDSLTVVPEYLMTNTPEVIFLAANYHDDRYPDSLVTTYDEVKIYGGKESRFDKSYSYSYKFFSEEGSVTGVESADDKLNGISYNIYCKKGWTIIQTGDNKREWMVHLPALSYSYVFRF